MNSKNIIKYINENEIDYIVAAILKQGKEIDSVIQQIKDSRVEYQEKSQQLQWALEKWRNVNEPRD